MPTAFKQVADNATSTTGTDLTSSGVRSLAFSSGDGVKFPTPGNGFWLTLWNGPDPGADSNAEKVLVSALNGDTVTHSATTKTHASPCNVGLLDVSSNVVDLQTAINNLELSSIALAAAL